MSNESKSMPGQLAERAVDVRNEIIVQSANAFVMARRALLASLGVVALTLEEGNQFIDKLVERGEVAEADVSKMLNDFRLKSQAREEKASDARRTLTEKASLVLEDSMETILNRFNVPTKNDIEELSKKITQLTERIAALKNQNGSN